MTRPFRQTLIRLAPLLVVWAGSPAGAADLPFLPRSAPAQADRFDMPGAGGFRVARIPVRPAPLRYDVYGYPVLGAIPDPLAVGNGCPPALQPNYDAAGNFAGYSPIPLCR